MSQLKELSPEEMQESYSKYFFMTMAEQPQDLLDEIKKGPMDSRNALPIDARNELCKPGYLASEVGYCSMPDGTAYASNITLMPNVSKEMFEWWFVWHGLNPLRYKIWDPDDHFGLVTDKVEQLTNPDIPIKERIWGVTHRVNEDIGLGAEELAIHFQSPEEMGFDVALMEQHGVSIICANLNDTMMCHTFRNKGTGIELRSRFWFGYNIENKKVVRKIPQDVVIPLDAAKGLTFHNVKEYSNLAKILPLVYLEEKDKFN
ncbi:DAPG hydrolase family protein [Vibrio furnissii]|uniref:DAPG hydrolase family protein n=1 Tax=Vibrio furnissii TaxID=29494 RepID=UPI0024BB19BC|nr:hypothetical protein [Vibrio furnissii]WHR51012.1 hypothetical protein O8413_13545 [Vibrio furnissii]WJG21969.1 hypothetical protein QSU95_02005 [Vibrio furnissii]